MLKAEATDLKNYPVYFDFKPYKAKISRLYKSMSNKQNENSLVEINAAKHIEIDQIVFDMLGYNGEEAKEIIEKTISLISYRMKKSKNSPQ